MTIESSLELFEREKLKAERRVEDLSRMNYPQKEIEAVKAQVQQWIYFINELLKVRDQLLQANLRDSEGRPEILRTDQGNQAPRAG